MAELKSMHAIAYADAFAVATALEFLTGNPEIEPLEGEQNLKAEWLSGRPESLSDTT